MKQSSPLSAIRHGARAALQWRLLILWCALLLAPTLVLAVPVWKLLGGALDHSVHATALAQRLDALGAFDVLNVFKREGAAVQTAGVLSFAITLLLSPLLSSLAITAARHPTPARFGQLTTGALALYGRMARMLVWSMVPLGAALALGAWIGTLAKTHNQAAILEDDASRASMLALAAALLIFAVAHATVDAGRAVLAAQPQRRSAVKAWWAGLRLVVRRPLAALGAWLLFGMVGLALAAAFGLARAHLPALGAGSIVLGLVLTQAAALALAWSRAARLFALVALAPSPRGSGAAAAAP